MKEFEELRQAVAGVMSLLAAAAGAGAAGAAGDAAPSGAAPPDAGGLWPGNPLAVATDQELAELVVAVEDAGRLLDAVRVAVAGEVADRSRHGLGGESMAVKYGHKSGKHLLETLTRVSPAEVARRVRVGSGIRPRTAPVSGEPLPPEHGIVAAAVRDGSVGIDAAAVILRFSDTASRTATAELVAEAERALVDTARHRGADEVAVQASVWLAALDPDGAEPRDERIAKRRGFVLGAERDGLTPFSGHLIPADAALLKDAFADADNPATGPRFLTDTDRRTGTVFHTDDNGVTEIRFLDTRTRTQRHYDTITGLVRAGTRSNGTEPGAMRPTATITAVITLNDLRQIIRREANHHPEPHWV